MGVSLYLDGYSASIQGARNNLTIPRMFSAVHKPSGWGYSHSHLPGASLLDSGAFSDKPETRLSPEQALERQLRWEQIASEKWSVEWQAYGLVSYDLLIDETWVEDTKLKRRWEVATADWAVTETIASAAYLSRQRARLYPRRLVMSAQGVDAIQYKECVVEVLKYCQPEDIFGLGGWCILGMKRAYLPTFWQTMHLVLPLIANAGIKDVHIFGVLWEPALAGLLYLTDKHGLRLSTDSGKPIMD